MQAVELKPNVYWVGGIDWDIRNFHGYKTWRGTTYNAYLIIDEKITLIDTVKHYLCDELIERIKSVVDPKKIDYVISNHVEMDHSGSLPKIMKLCKNATIITSPKGQKGLEKHYEQDWKFQTVKSGEQISIGKRSLQFVHIPMVHWPDSMVSFCPEEKILFPNDAFGQHIAGSHRFDDQIGWSLLKEEAAKYYANIVMPYGPQVQNALKALSSLDIEMIAPSHGIVWRSYINEIIEEYKKWSTFKKEKSAVIIYDSMWGSTEKMAYALLAGFEKAKIPVALRNLKENDISDIVTDVLSAGVVAVGSPTLNNSMLPSIGGFLTYLVGLRPKNKIGFVFGSYGWGGQAVGDIKKSLEPLSWEYPIDEEKTNYIPSEADLEKLKEIGFSLGKKLVKNDSN